jgi:putative nucleotidyltransferase with HDIG domain
MSLFGIKRGRNVRGAGLRIAPSPAADLRSVLADRRVLSRLLLGLVAISGLLVCVQGWKQAFPYRLEQRPVAGVAAVIDFQRLNRERTARARDRAAEQAPPVFRSDDQSRARLPQQLQNAILSINTAAELSALPAEARRAFGLSAEGVGTAGTPVADRTETFQRLRELAGDEARLKDVIADFRRFIQPLQEFGLLRPEHIPAELSAGGTVAVQQADGALRTINLADVQVVQLLAPAGRLHSRWALFPAILPYRTEFEHWLKNQSPETLFFDAAATQAARQKARDSATPVYDFVKKGDLLVQPGQSIDAEKLELLQAEYDTLEAGVSVRERFVRAFIVFLMLATLAMPIGYHLVRHEPKLVWSAQALSLYLALLVLSLGLARLLSYDPWRADLAPVLVAVMVCAIVHNQVLATLTAFALSLAVTLSTGADIGRFTVLMSACATAGILLPSVPSRSTLVVVGLWAAAVCFLMTWGTAVIESLAGVVDGLPGVPLWQNPGEWKQSLRDAGWCLAAGFLVSGSLPMIESTFGAVTDISLLELGDVSHPLLQELVRRAPGTYNHSITVASIGETAADAIGTNGLLVRVGAYFHDIGKMLKPHYFVENMSSGENRHEHLAPAMSTLIIIGHVKDGADLARQHNLPQALVDFIDQHHGTTLVEYFYHEATKQAEEHPDHRTDADEARFRYPGPKPQTREAAVLMIADAVEGASRTLSEPTPSRIESLVHEIGMKRLLDGQFDECGLTMTELVRVEESLTKSLIAMYHGRVKYPEQRTA